MGHYTVVVSSFEGCDSNPLSTATLSEDIL